MTHGYYYDHPRITDRLPRLFLLKGDKVIAAGIPTNSLFRSAIQFNTNAHSQRSARRTRKIEKEERAGCRRKSKTKIRSIDFAMVREDDFRTVRVTHLERPLCCFVLRNIYLHSISRIRGHARTRDVTRGHAKAREDGFESETLPGLPFPSLDIHDVLWNLSSSRYFFATPRQFFGTYHSLR